MYRNVDGLSKIDNIGTRVSTITTTFVTITDGLVMVVESSCISKWDYKGAFSCPSWVGVIIGETTRRKIWVWKNVITEIKLTPGCYTSIVIGGSNNMGGIDFNSDSTSYGCI